MTLALRSLSLKVIAPAVAVPVCLATRKMTTDGLKSFNDKERAAETIWFNKEEEKLINKMVQRMKSTDQDSGPHQQTLEGLANKYNMSDADKKVILQAANGMTIAGLMQMKKDSKASA